MTRMTRPRPDPVADDVITAEFAVQVFEHEIAACDRRIERMTAEIKADPREAIRVGTDLARWGFTKEIYERAIQVALGNMTIQRFEQSLSARMISLAGNGAGQTVDSLLTEKQEVYAIEDALHRSGPMGTLFKIEGIKSQSTTVPTDAGFRAKVEAIVNDPAKLAALAETAYPNLSTAEDRDERQTDVLNVLEALRDTLTKDQ